MSAYHEAGHAVVAYRLGLEIKHVSLSECFLNLRSIDDFDDFLAASLAGGIAQKIHNPAHCGEPSPGDVELIRAYYPKLHDPIGSYFVPELWPARFALASDKAGGILTANWPVVQRLAMDLSYRGFLSGDEVKAILGTL